jgi:hypothetical protein
MQGLDLSSIGVEASFSSCVLLSVMLRPSVRLQAFVSCVRASHGRGSADNVLRVKGMECNGMGANELID